MSQTGSLEPKSSGLATTAGPPNRWCHHVGLNHPGTIRVIWRCWHQAEGVAHTCQASTECQDIVCFTYSYGKPLNVMNRLDGNQGRLVTLERQLAAGNRLVMDAASLIIIFVRLANYKTSYRTIPRESSERVRNQTRATRFVLYWV